MPVDPAQRGDVLGSAGVVGDDDPHPSPVGGGPDAVATERGHVLGVAVARDHDRHRAFPACGTSAAPSSDRPRGRAELHVAPQRREPQRERDHAIDHRRDPVVLVGQVDPAPQAAQVRCAAVRRSRAFRRRSQAQMVTGRSCPCLDAGPGQYASRAMVGLVLLGIGGRTLLVGPARWR